jgi:hypothetical protein
MVHRVVNEALLLFRCRFVPTAALLMLHSYGVMANR